MSSITKTLFYYTLLLPTAPDKALTIQTLLQISLKHILTTVTSFVGSLYKIH